MPLDGFLPATVVRTDDREPVGRLPVVRPAPPSPQVVLQGLEGSLQLEANAVIRGAVVGVLLFSSQVQLEGGGEAVAQPQPDGAVALSEDKIAVGGEDPCVVEDAVAQLSP